MAVVVEADNLSVAWAKAALAVVAAGEVLPLVVQVRLPGDGSIPESGPVRLALDQHLRGIGAADSHTVANTIFPQSLWNRQRPMGDLFARYNTLWPRIQRARGNHNGVYFQRMIAFPGRDGNPVNQLEHVVNTYHGGNHRRSALAASIFDPSGDHSDQRRRGFPCLDHVLFTPGAGGSLTVTGYYATQDLVRKAYGNYLGLARLGVFMSSQMGLALTGVTCIASIAMRGGSKRAFQPLAATLIAARGGGCVGGSK